MTVPLSTLLALTETPCDLTGLGPIPATLARELADQILLAAREGHWRCAIVEDRPGHPHGTLLGLGRSTFTPSYSPSDATRRYLRTRDTTCSFPGCTRTTRPTRSTGGEHPGDLDHRRPWPQGPTCDCNLQTLCRTHHTLKHHTLPTGCGFTARAAPAGAPGPPGRVTWTTPTGRSYPSDPEPIPF